MKYILVIMLVVITAACSNNSIGSLVQDVESIVIGEETQSGEVNTESKTFPGQSFDSIAVNTEAMQLLFEPSPDNTAQVQLTTSTDIANSFVFDADIRNGELQIEVDEQTKSFADGQTGVRTLRISLPERLYDAITVRNKLGSVTVDRMQADRIDIKLDAGSIRVNEAIGEMLIYTDAGNIEIEKFGLNHDLTAGVAMGDIRITLQEEAQSGTFSLTSELGEAAVGLDGIQYNLDTRSRKSGAIGSGQGHHIEASVEIGSLRLEPAGQ